MFRSGQELLDVWMQALKATVTVLVFLAPAFAVALEIDHPVQPMHPQIASFADMSADDSGPVQPMPETNCHTGHGCVPAIMPDDGPPFARFGAGSEIPDIGERREFGVKSKPFHPPRIFSQV